MQTAFSRFRHSCRCGRRPSGFGEEFVKAGALSCDVSAGISLILVQKQTLRCVFTSTNGAPDLYNGRIDEFGVALGEVAKGHLIGAVFAPASGVPHGALAGQLRRSRRRSNCGCGARRHAGWRHWPHFLAAAGVGRRADRRQCRGRNHHCDARARELGSRGLKFEQNLRHLTEALICATSQGLAV